MKSPGCYVVLFAYGEFDRIEKRDTYDIARAFADGFMYGASQFGGHGIGAYVMPNDEGDMRAENDPDAIAAAFDHLAEVERAS